MRDEVNSTDKSKPSGNNDAAAVAADRPAGGDGHIPPHRETKTGHRHRYHKQIIKWLHRWTIPMATVAIACMTGVYTCTSDHQWRAMLDSNNISRAAFVAANDAAISVVGVQSKFPNEAAINTISGPTDQSSTLA
jgi:hypothetical protein